MAKTSGIRRLKSWRTRRSKTRPTAGQVGGDAQIDEVGRVGGPLPHLLHGRHGHAAVAFPTVGAKAVRPLASIEIDAPECDARRIHLVLGTRWRHRRGAAANSTLFREPACRGVPPRFGARRSRGSSGNPNPSRHARTGRTAAAGFTDVARGRRRLNAAGAATRWKRSVADTRS